MAPAPAALFIGNNGASLFYAESDARRLRDTFVRLGGIGETNAVLLTGAAVEQVREALASSVPSIIYFSGNETDAAVELLRAHEGIVFFDVHGADADGPPVFQVDGTKVTARFTNARAKESDVVASGYFGYHLAAALLGAADGDGDGHVSFDEAVTWSVERTGKMAPLPAVPADLPPLAQGEVLTDLAARGEGLLFPSATPGGPYYFVDSRGVVVAELMKEGSTRFLALPPGTYTVKRRLVDRLRIGELTIAPHEVHTFDETRLQNAKFSEDPVTGVTTTPTFARHWSVSVLGGYQVSFGIFPNVPVIGGQITLHNALWRGLSVSVDGAYGWAFGEVNVPNAGAAAFQSSRVTFGAALFYEFFPDGRWIPFAGVHVAFEFLSRTFDDDEWPQQSFSTIAPGIIAGLKVRVFQNFSALATVRSHYLHYDTGGPRPTGSVEFLLSLNYEFR